MRRRWADAFESSSFVPSSSTGPMAKCPGRGPGREVSPTGAYSSCNLLLPTPIWAASSRSKGGSQDSRRGGSLGTSPVQGAGCRDGKSIDRPGEMVKAQP